MEDDALFGRSHIEDEPFDALPPPLSPGQDQGDPFGDAENGELSKLADVPEAKRKGVKRPQPKLDSNRLISDRGLPALRTLFNNVQYKGKGHEAEDVCLLMKRMENWAHRLFPKLQFEDFIDKVERLGTKKEVQTCLKRIRLDMPLTHDDFTGNQGEEVVPDDVQMQIFGDPDPFGGEHLSASPLRLVHSTPAPGASAARSVDPSLGSSPPSAPSLTEEQRRRMEENRLKALERRLAKQKRQQEESQASESQTAEPQTTEPEASEASEPQIAEPEASEPQTRDPEASELQTRDPEASEPQTRDPEASELQTREPEASEPQTREPEASEPQTREPEASEPQTREPEASEPQTREPEASEHQTREPEASEHQTREPEASKALELQTAEPQLQLMEESAEVISESALSPS